MAAVFRSRQTGEQQHDRVDCCRAHHHRRGQIRGIQDQGRPDDRQAGRALPDKGWKPQDARGRLWKPERVVIIEFPDMDSLNAWYNSPEYQPLIALRNECTSDLDTLITLEGA